MSADAGGPERQGDVEVDSGQELAVPGRLHPDYVKFDLVPSFVVPTTHVVGTAILGLVGGTVLGVGMAPVVASNMKLRVIRQLAKACVESEEDCDSLQVQTSSASLGWLALGVLLVALYALLMISQQRRARAQDRSRPAAPSRDAPKK